MNYYGAKELANSFRTVRKNTIQTAEDIPEDQYGFTPAEGTRSIARTLVHIALSPKLHLEIHAGERRTRSSRRPTQRRTRRWCLRFPKSGDSIEL